MAERVTAAAEVYFGKDLDELTIAEAAALPVPIRNPSVYDLRDADEAFRTFWEEKSPLGRWGEPEDIARAVVDIKTSIDRIKEQAANVE